jgi:hypothetical protein
MKQTAVEYLAYMWSIQGAIYVDDLNKALEIERDQIIKAKKISEKEAYDAGQKSMYCGCYDITDSETFEDWVYDKFKEEE